MRKDGGGVFYIKRGLVLLKLQIFDQYDNKISKSVGGQVLRL